MMARILIALVAAVGLITAALLAASVDGYASTHVIPTQWLGVISLAALIIYLLVLVVMACHEDTKEFEATRQRYGGYDDQDS